MVAEPPVPRMAPTGASSGDLGAHIGGMNAPAAPSLATLPDTTRDKVVRVSVELFGVAETAELLACAANLATKDDIAELRTELKAEIAALRAEVKDDIAGLRSELKDAMRNQAIALISATAALQLATIAVVASLVR